MLLQIAFLGRSGEQRILLRRKAVTARCTETSASMSGLFMCMEMFLFFKDEIKRWKFTCLSHCLCNTHTTAHLPLLNVWDGELTTVGVISRECDKTKRKSDWGL